LQPNDGSAENVQDLSNNAQEMRKEINDEIA
jgi:hypothetical protein